MENGKLQLKSLIEGFRLTCQTEGKSPRTIEWYTAFLGRFLIFLGRNGFPANVNKIGKGHVKEFIRYLQMEARTPAGKQLSGATIQGYVRTLKAFFSWAVREEYLDVNVMSNIPVPKAMAKLIHTLSTGQIAGLLDECQRTNGTGCRNLTMLLLMLDCGLRVSELVGIRLPDVDIAGGQIRLNVTKGGRQRIVPVGSITQKLLWRYLEQCRPQPVTASHDRLFLSADGFPLTKSGVQQMLRRCGKRAGISGVRCSPHTLRHTFAKNYLLNGGDIFSLQKILGHSSLASVRTYLNLFAVDIKKQHQRFSPVDSMAGARRICHMSRPTRRS